MTLFEFAVPLVAIAVALAGIAVLRHQDRKFDRRPQPLARP